MRLVTAVIWVLGICADMFYEQPLFRIRLNRRSSDRHNSYRVMRLTQNSNLEGQLILAELCLSTANKGSTVRFRRSDTEARKSGSEIASCRMVSFIFKPEQLVCRHSEHDCVLRRSR